MVPLVFALALCLPAAPATAQDRSETTHDKTATIDFLDVGQGDAILIRSPEGKRALIDAGPSKEIVRLIRERGVKSIDLVVVSHHHADHYGGMDDCDQDLSTEVLPCHRFLTHNAALPETAPSGP